MAEKSVGSEFLEPAIEIERNGYDFYEHEYTFRDMLMRLGGYVPENPRENYQYIKNLAGSGIFSAKQAQALLTRKTMTDIEAVKAGIGFEKDSILPYSEVRGTVPRQDQDIIDMITNEGKSISVRCFFWQTK